MNMEKYLKFIVTPNKLLIFVIDFYLKKYKFIDKRFFKKNLEISKRGNQISVVCHSPLFHYNKFFF